MKKRKLQFFTTVLGILLSVAVVCSHVLLPENNERTAENDKTKTEQSQDSRDEFQFVTAPTLTPPASATIESSLWARCIFVLEQLEETTVDVVNEAELAPQKFFFRLFRVIISPNAP